MLVTEVRVRAWLAVLSLTWLAAAAVAQTSSIQGTVFGPDGKAVDGAPVQARNPETGATFRTVSAATGSCSETSIRRPCGKFGTARTVRTTG